MPASAPRISRKLLEEIERIDGSISAADLCRLLGEMALRLGLAQPSYQLVSKDTLIPVAGDDGQAGGYTAAAESLRRRADRDELQIVRAEEVLVP